MRAITSATGTNSSQKELVTTGFRRFIFGLVSVRARKSSSTIPAQSAQREELPDSSFMGWISRYPRTGYASTNALPIFDTFHRNVGYLLIHRDR